MRGLMLMMFLFSVVLSANAQGTCVPDELVTPSLEGRVVFKREAGEDPIKQASVQLLESRYQGRVIATATSDVNGAFKFAKKIKPGKYMLKVTYPELATYHGPVRFIKPGTGSNAQEIVVTLGADFTKPCGGSSAAVTARKTN
jgi:hypothetical protein